MAIYTKTGDAGTTALFDGTRVPKNSLRVDTYGTFDELNAQVSVCEKLVISQDNKHVLHTLQHQLFRLCAERFPIRALAIGTIFFVSSGESSNTVAIP
jgi:ATP:cob(I)alamin adenosyltransferase